MTTPFKLSGQAGHLLKGLAAFGLAELSVRVVRLVSILFIARQLSPEIVGEAALTLTLFELIRVLANIGVGQKIIAAPEAELAACCNTARGIFWAWCGGVALFQLLVAAILALVFDETRPAAMLAVLSLVYLWMPGGLVQCYLLMRAGKAAATARTAAIQTIADHILTAILLLIWPNPWSIILPKLLTAPVWLVLTRRAYRWQPLAEAGHAPLRDMLRFGLPVLATEAMLALRTQADKLVIASTLGLTALGTYFFAFNAGIGIVSSLITAFGTVLFPNLCAVPAGRARSHRFSTGLALGSAIFITLVLVQALLAPWYVPIIFGQHWAHAASLVSVLCLAGLSLFATTATTAWLRAEHAPALDAWFSLFTSIGALIGLFAGAHSAGLLGAAWGWVIGLSVTALPFALIVISRAIRTSSSTPAKEALA